jgi:hypothetical protein
MFVVKHDLILQLSATLFSWIGYVVLTGNGCVSGKLKGVWEEVAMIYFKALSQDMSARIEEIP